MFSSVNIEQWITALHYNRYGSYGNGNLFGYLSDTGKCDISVLLSGTQWSMLTRWIVCEKADLAEAVVTNVIVKPLQELDLKFPYGFRCWFSQVIRHRLRSDSWRGCSHSKTRQEPLRSVEIVWPYRRHIDKAMALGPCWVFKWETHLGLPGVR